MVTCSRSLFFQKFIEGNPYRRGRCVAIFIHRNIDALARHGKALDYGFNNADVGLMRNEPANVIFSEPSAIDALLARALHPTNGMLEDLLTSHFNEVETLIDALFRGWLSASPSRHFEYLCLVTIGTEANVADQKPRALV